MNIEKKKELFCNVVFACTFVISIFFIIQSLFNQTLLNDYYWHYKVGEWIIKNKEIPTTGIFSWYAIENNLYWFSHEWLSGVLLYLLSFGSKEGAIISIFVLHIVMQIFFLVYTKPYIKKNFLLYIFFHIIVCFTTCIFFYPRPHVFSYILLIAELAILRHFKEVNEKTKLIYLLPVISILWANIHGGSSNLVYILPIFVLLTSFKDINLGNIYIKKLEKSSLIKLVIVIFLCILGILVNPHTYKLLLYPMENMNNSLMMSIITEWASPDLKKTTSLLRTIPLVFCVLCMFSSKKKINLYHILLLGFFTFLFLRSERFVVLLDISMMFYIFEYANTIETEKIFNWKLLYKASLYTFGIVFAITFMVISCINIINDRTIDIYDTYLSNEAIEIIKEYKPQRLYNHYNLGGELIYNDIDVFIDGRADMYTNHNLEDFNDMITVNLKDGDWNIEKVLEKYNFDMFVCYKTDKTMIYFNAHPDKYKKIYSSENAFIYIPINE